MAVTTAIRQWSQGLLAELTGVAGNIIEFIPGLAVAVLALLIAWIIGKILERLIVLGMDAVKADELLARGPVNHNALEAAGVTQLPSRIIGVLIFWAFFFFFGLVPAANSLGLTAGRILVDRVVFFIPQVLGALLVVVAALFVAGLLREIICSLLTTANLHFGRELGWFAYVVILVFGSGLALRVLGVPLVVITVFLAIAGSTIGLILAVGFGVGARDVFGAIAAGRELRGRVAEGDEITVDNYAGTIERFGLDAVDLRTRYGVVSIPNHRFIQKVVVIKSSGRRVA